MSLNKRLRLNTQFFKKLSCCGEIEMVEKFAVGIVSKTTKSKRKFNSGSKPSKKVQALNAEVCVE